MNKKLVLSGIILLTLVITVGAYAYTYSQVGTTTLAANPYSEDFVVSEPSPSEEQPAWDDILPQIGPSIELLVPDAAGDKTNITGQWPLTGEHWDKVQDIPADDWDTYVYGTGTGSETDEYDLTDHSEGEGPINSVTVYFRFAGYEDGGTQYTVRARAVLRVNATDYPGSHASQTGQTFTTSSYTWAANPATNQAWTWDDIDALQAGVTLWADDSNASAFCTQVYVAVDYTPPPVVQGDVPEGNLFTITPAPEYTGDMLVKVYLTNTGLLSPAYKYLNIKLYMENSLEAEKTPDYQLLTMENGVAIFNIEGGSAVSYNVEVGGGSWGLTSGYPEEWGDEEDWTITPEFYCEVSQRGF